MPSRFVSCLALPWARSVAVQYDYDPYGNPTTLSGSATSDIGYAGYFQHAASGLDFAVYRAYDSAHARWLNRDPAGEPAGINLYAYVLNNPLLYADPSGEAPPYELPPLEQFIGGLHDVVDPWTFGALTEALPYLGAIALGAVIGTTGGMIIDHTVCGSSTCSNNIGEWANKGLNPTIDDLVPPSAPSGPVSRLPAPGPPPGSCFL